MQEITGSDKPKRKRDGTGKTVSVTLDAYKKLREVAKRDGVPMGRIIARMLRKAEQEAAAAGSVIGSVSWATSS